MTTPTPTPSAMYTELVEAIVKAVPEANQKDCHCDDKRCRHRIRRPITLEDVLRWLRKTEDGNSIAVTSGGVFIEFTFDEDYGGSYQELSDGRGCIVVWLLGKPLSEQSPETISFLHSLLCKL